RNALQIQVYNVSHKGTIELGKHFLQWGAGIDHTIINDHLNEWEYQDSAGYSLPFNPDQINLSSVLKSNANLLIDKYRGYVQDNIRLSKTATNVTFQG